MTERRFSRMVSGVAVAYGLGSIMITLALAQHEAHKLTLRTIMSELGAEYVQIATGLLIEDFKTLQESSRAIQGHPLPDEIVAAIKHKLGNDFQVFEQIDEQTHQAADDLAERAAAKDITGSAKAFEHLVESCVDCHKEFRATLRPLSD